jgi:hypothetical protein
MLPGPSGPKGRTEKAGARGERRVAGAGAAADRLDLLGIVETQIEDVYRELDTQRKRTLQLQVQFDELAAHVHGLTARLGSVIDRLQTVVDAASTYLPTSDAADRAAASK